MGKYMFQIQDLKLFILIGFFPLGMDKGHAREHFLELQSE